MRISEPPARKFSIFIKKNSGKVLIKLFQKFADFQGRALSRPPQRSELPFALQALTEGGDRSFTPRALRVFFYRDFVLPSGAYIYLSRPTLSGDDILIILHISIMDHPPRSPFRKPEGGSKRARTSSFSVLNIVDI